MINFLIIFAAFSSASSAEEHHLYEADQIGEYYEYDLEGTHEDRVKREIYFHAEQVAKAPFMAIRWCYRVSRSGLRKVKESAEMFLGDTGQGMEPGNVLSDWQADVDRSDRGCLPHAGQGLKKALYAVGFRLPRATMRKLKRVTRSAFAECGSSY